MLVIVFDQGRLIEGIGRALDDSLDIEGIGKVLALPVDALGGVQVAERFDVELAADLHVARIGDVRLGVARSFLGRDDDHAIGSTNAPDRGRGCVFQNGDLLDVVGVYVKGIVFHRETVHDDQRSGLGVERCLAADNHLALAIDGQTGNDTFEAVHHVVGHDLIHLIVGHHGIGTGGPALLDGLVTGDDRFGDDHIGVHLHVFLDVLLARFEGEVGVFHTQVGEFQRGTLHGNFEGKEAVLVGNGADTGFTDAHRNADERFPVCVADIAADGAGAAAQLLGTDANDVAFDSVLAFDQVDQVADHLFGGPLPGLDGHLRPGFGQVGGINEIQAGLLL